MELGKGDLRDISAVRKAAKDISHLFHVAAIRAVGRSVDDPRETNDVNITGTLNLLLAAKENGVKRVVFSSSSAVYGENDRCPFKETLLPEPLSPYAASKVMGEYYCRIFSNLYGLETVLLRYFNVYGPKQNPESKYSMVIPVFIECLLHERSPEIHWDGKQSRDFVYIDDVVKSNLLGMD